MSVRSQWRFAYKAADLVKPARDKEAHHRERAEWWRVELVKAEAKLKASGVELRTYPVSGGHRYEAVVDPTLGQRVSECKGKVEEHEKLADEYAMYARAFELSPDATLLLDVEDIRFFGL